MTLELWKSIPPGWHQTPKIGPIFMWAHNKRHLSVGASLEVHDANTWIHVSISHRKHVPTYNDLMYLRRHWIGDRKTIMVWPTEEYYVNMHPNCLHLYAPLYAHADPLPEFNDPARLATQY